MPVLAITTIGDLLLRRRITETNMNDSPVENIQLTIPEYQRPYKWKPKNVSQLLEDILHAVEEKRSFYRVGTLILHREGEQNIYNIVDGQQRTITFALLLRVLQEQLKKEDGFVEEDIPFFAQKMADDPHTRANLVKNCRALQRRIRDLVGEAKNLLDYVKNHCEMIVVITGDQTEAFQFFDSQNARGKKLYPHDLLKAYHLREMRELDATETERTVRIWENADQIQLARLFADYLYCLKEWLKGNRSTELTEQNIDQFKGIAERDIYPYAQYYKGAYAYAENVNRSALPFVMGVRRMIPFQIDGPIIAGKAFFDYAQHYLTILADIQDNDKFDGYYINGNEIVQTLNKYSRGVGDRIARRLFDMAVLLYVDRFCPERPTLRDTELLERFVVFVFVWAYSLRLQYENLGWLTAQNYILGMPAGNKPIRNAFNMYKTVAEADSPERLLAELADLVQPLTRSCLFENLQNRLDEKQPKYADLVNIVKSTGFWEEQG